MKELNFDQRTPAAPVAGPPDKDARAVARKARDAARKRIERAVKAPSPVIKFWFKNETVFAQTQTERWAELHDRHLDVEATNWEMQTAMAAFDHGESVREAIMTDVPVSQIYQEVKADIERFGTLSYCSIEASQGDSEGYTDFRSAKYNGTPESAYRNFGMRLCLEASVLHDFRAFLVVYALTTQDSNLNPDIVEEAVSSLGLHRSRYSDQARTLINRRNGIVEHSTELCTQVPISESIPRPISEVDRIIALKKTSTEQYDRWIREARREER